MIGDDSMAGRIRYPETREEVALKLLAKIMMAERKPVIFGAAVGAKGKYREETLELLARCIAAVDGRHGKDAPAAALPAEGVSEGSQDVVGTPVLVNGEPA
jgi:hypothetical protein